MPVCRVKMHDGILTSQVEQKSQTQKGKSNPVSKTGRPPHNLQCTTTLVNSKSKARQHTAMSHDRIKATSRLHKKKEFEKPGAFILQLRWIRVVKIKRVEYKMRRVNKAQFRRPLKPGQRMAQWLAHRPVTKWTQVRIWVVAALDESWLWGPKKDRKAILMTSITQKERSL